MLLLPSPPLPPPVVPRLLRRASRWQPRAGPREQGPGRRAPSPPRRVPVQPPPAAGDAATSRLSISRGSAARLLGLPPKVGARLPGAVAGPRKWEPPRRRSAPLPRRRRPALRRALRLRPGTRSEGRGLGTGGTPAARGVARVSRLRPLRPGRLCRSRQAGAAGAADAWAGCVIPRERRVRAAPLRLPLASAPSSRPRPCSREGGETRFRLRRFLPEVGVWCLALLARSPEGEPFNFSRNASPAPASRAGWVGRGMRAAPRPPRRREGAGGPQVHPARRGPSPGWVPV